MSKVGFDDYQRATGATSADVDALPSVPAWPEMAREAYCGLPGRIVDTIDPYSEADPVATLAHVLVAAGNLIGPDPHCQVLHDRHPARLYAALVGASSKGRKGLAWSTPRYLLTQADAEWARTRIVSGLSSGEGLIYHVRDERAEQQPVKTKGRVVGYETVIVDSGIDDKRLLVLEPELASVFKRMNGDSNTLSAVLRDAWDDRGLATLTKNSPLRATGAHVSLIGHVTDDELRLHLTETERANGFGNRFLYFLVRRSKTLPDGDPVPSADLAPLVPALAAVARRAHVLGPIARDPEAADLWRSIYPALSAGEPGLVGALLGRAEAQVLRLSLIYALLDSAAAIRPAHQLAAVAVWDYCAASVRRIFGGRLGLTIADTILEALRQRGSLTTTDISNLFGRHRAADEIRVALDVLRTAGKIRCTERQTAGRTATVWELIA
jgi:hypothetical protein